MDSNIHCSCCNLKRPRDVQCTREYNLLHVIVIIIIIIIISSSSGSSIVI